MTTRPKNESRSVGPAPAPAVIDAWWDAVLAGEKDEPHPIHGERLRVHFKEGRLVLSGELGSRRDRDELLRQAAQRIAGGVREVDSSGLKVMERRERSGTNDHALPLLLADQR
jgi:hypothetical protein